MGESRAWSLLTIADEERQFGGNLGYKDALGARYAWDTSVPNGKNIGEGDLIVLRDSRSVLGVGWIDEIVTADATKKRIRCPECRGTSFKRRKTLSPPYKWLNELAAQYSQHRLSRT